MCICASPEQHVRLNVIVIVMRRLLAEKNVIVKSAHSLHYRLHGYDTSIISTCSLQIEQATQSTRTPGQRTPQAVKVLGCGLGATRRKARARRVQDALFGLLH
jgi:hypothetical protein